MRLCGIFANVCFIASGVIATFCSRMIFPHFIQNAVARPVIAEIQTKRELGVGDRRNTIVAPREIIVFASNGILEAMNADDPPFGFDRSAGVLRNLTSSSSAENISAAILDAIDEFSGRPMEAHDDHTLIVLRLTGNRDEKQGEMPRKLDAVRVLFTIIFGLGVFHGC